MTRTATKRIESLRALRTASPAHSAQGPLRPLEYGAPASMKEYGSQETLLDSASPVVRRSSPSSAACAWRGYAMSELRRKGVRRSDLKIIASDTDLAAITKDVEALNDA